MNPDHCENIRIFFRQLDRAPAAFNRRADSNDASHTGFICAPQHVVKIGREIRVIEMGVSFYDCHFDGSKAEGRNLLLFIRAKV